jgi:DNA-binding Lrp family transcriptional regulator
MMSKRNNKKCAQIIQVILEITEKFPTGRASQTIPVNCREIANDIDRLTGANSRSKMLEFELSELLNSILSTENDIETISSVLDQRNKCKFAVNTECILTLIQFQYVDVAIKQRFGIIENRIIKYLNSAGPQEQKQISEVCMVPQNETLDILYKLMKMGYVKTLHRSQTNTSCISKRAIKWGFSLLWLQNKVLRDIVHTVLNILLRSWQEDYIFRKTHQENKEALFNEFRLKSHNKIQKKLSTLLASTSETLLILLLNKRGIKMDQLLL